jgi:GNAT superfamily N-acetyltransferase
LSAFSFSVFTLAQRPDLEEQVQRLGSSVGPEIVYHDAVANRYWGSLFADFAGFQVAVCAEGDRVVAFGNTIPVYWDGTEEGLPAGLDAVLERGVRDYGKGRRPNTLSALAAVVAQDHQGRGLSATVLNAMKSVAAEHGFGALIAPVRPTLKDRYPLTPMERYVEWKRDDGLPFDPWLRTHARLGAEFLCVAPRSMLITGKIREWEEWTDMHFPESGRYVVPGALEPVVMDIEEDVGVYVEPNVWMRHSVDSKTG